MGTRFRIVLYAADEARARQGLCAAFERIDALERALSDFDPQSELSCLSRHSAAGAPTRPIPVSPDLLEVLLRAEDVARLSRGAFDPTLGPCVDLWRRAARQGELPTAGRLAQALARCGFGQLELDRERACVRLLTPDMRLDLGGIAKGFACDEALAVLDRAGLGSALVEGGGDLAVGDPPPGSRGWKIALEPFRDATEPASERLLLARAGVATSGDRYRRLDIDGRRYSHILDPATGLGLERRVAATVVAPRATEADAWATALSVLDPEDGCALVEALEGLEARVVELDPRDDSVLAVRETSGFAVPRLAPYGEPDGS